MVMVKTYPLNVQSAGIKRRRTANAECLAKKHSSLWWSLPRLNRDLIQCKQWLELTDYTEGIGCLSLQQALTLLLWLRSLVLILTTVTGARCKNRELPIAVCRVAQINACYIALNMAVQGACALGAWDLRFTALTVCVFILNKSRVVCLQPDQS